MNVAVESQGGVKECQESTSMERIEDELFSNLVLLGMSPELAEKKYGCTITPEMFRASNSKGLEAVLYYLLSRVSSEAKDAFRVIWPITDQKQAREFRRVANQVLQKLERENHIPSGTFRVSHLTSASGERLCIMLWHLSSYAMRVTMSEEMKNSDFSSISRLFPSVSSSTPIGHLETIKHATSLRISQQVDRFVSMVEQERHEEESLHELAFSLQQEYRSQSKRKLSLAQQSKELDSLPLSDSSSHSIEKSSLSTLSDQQSSSSIPSDIEEAWNVVVNHLDHWKASGKVLERVIEKRANITHLDAKPLGTPSHRNESRELDLTRIIHEWNSQLERIHTQLMEIKISDEKSKRRDLTKPLEKQHHSHKNRLNGSDKENMAVQGRNDENGDNVVMLTRLQELSRKLEQMALQHDQQVGVMRGVMEGVVKTEMVQMREMIESLSKGISNSNASSKMEYQLRSLLSMDESDRAVESKEENSGFLKTEAHQSTSKMQLSIPLSMRGTPTKVNTSIESKGSMGMLIPPTPRSRAPSAIPPTPSSLLISRNANMMSGTTLESPLTQSLSSLPSPSLHSHLRSLSSPSLQFSDTPRRTLSANGTIGTQGRSKNGNLRRFAPDAFFGHSGSQTPSTLARNRSSIASSWMNDFNEAHLAQELTNAISSSSLDPSSSQTTLSPISSPYPSNQSPLSADIISSKSTKGRFSSSPLQRIASTSPSTLQTTTPRSVSIGTRRHSSRGVVSQEKTIKNESPDSSSNGMFGSPFALHSQQAMMSFSPLYQTSTPVTGVRRENQESGRSASTPRTRGPQLLHPSSLTPYSGLTQQESGEIEHNGLEDRFSSMTPTTLPSLRPASPSPKEVERRQSIIMDELAEQIIDIMGSAGINSNHLSPSDITKHTMAILGIKSPGMIHHPDQETPSKCLLDQSRSIEAKQNLSSFSSSFGVSLTSHPSNIPPKQSSLGDISSSRRSSYRRSSSSSSGSRKVSSASSSNPKTLSSNHSHQRSSLNISDGNRKLLSNRGRQGRVISHQKPSFSNGFALAEMEVNRNSRSSIEMLDDEVFNGQDGREREGEGNGLKMASSSNRNSLTSHYDDALDQLDDSVVSYEGEEEGNDETMSFHSSFEYDELNVNIDDNGDENEMNGSEENGRMIRGGGGGGVRGNVKSSSMSSMPSMTLQQALLYGDGSHHPLDVSVSILEAQLADIDADIIGEEDDDSKQLDSNGLFEDQDDNGHHDHHDSSDWNEDDQDELERELQRLAMKEENEEGNDKEDNDDDDGGYEEDHVVEGEEEEEEEEEDHATIDDENDQYEGQEGDVPAYDDDNDNDDGEELERELQRLAMKHDTIHINHQDSEEEEEANCHDLISENDQEEDHQNVDIDDDHDATTASITSIPSAISTFFTSTPSTTSTASTSTPFKDESSTTHQQQQSSSSILKLEESSSSILFERFGRLSSSSSSQKQQHEKHKSFSLDLESFLMEDNGVSMPQSSEESPEEEKKKKYQESFILSSSSSSLTSFSSPHPHPSSDFTINEDTTDDSNISGVIFDSNTELLPISDLSISFIDDGVVGEGEEEGISHQKDHSSPSFGSSLPEKTHHHHPLSLMDDIDALDDGFMMENIGKLLETKTTVTTEDELIDDDDDHIPLPSSSSIILNTQSFHIPKTHPTQKQRLNLSINPDEDAQNDPSSISPGFDRIKKVLDFGS